MTDLLPRSEGSAAQAVEQRDAGRQLDAEIAERVMGFTGRTPVRKRGKDGYRIAFKSNGEKWGMGEYSVWYTEDGTKLYCGQPWAPFFAPEYSSDIACAFLVVEAMRAKGYSWRIGTGETDKAHVFAAFWKARGFLVQHSAEAATPALAICLAALAMLDDPESETQPTPSAVPPLVSPNTGDPTNE